MSLTETEKRGARIGDFNHVGTKIDRRTCSRVVPMKVLCLGRERTGTASIREAFFQLGLSHVYHYASVLHENPRDAEMWSEAFDAKFDGKGTFGKEKWDQLLGHCMAVTDVPCCLFAPELMDAYPDAKIILSVRDSPQKWAESIKSTMWRAYDLRGPLTEPATNIFVRIWRALLPVSPTEPMDKSYWENIGYAHNPEGLPALYEAHNQMILDEAKKRGREVLVFNVKEGWEPFCKFLGEEVPEKPFPRLNNETMFTSDLDFFKKIMIGVALFNAVKYLGMVAVPAFGVYWGMKNKYIGGRA